MKKNLLPVYFLILTLGISAQNDKVYDFKLVDVVPIHTKCSKELKNPELKICFQKNITKEIVKNLNFNIIKNQGLPPGKYKIYSIFSINKKGKIKVGKIDIKNKEIAKEISRVLKTIKKMTPAYLDGKPVSVNYAIPLTFKIDE